MNLLNVNVLTLYISLATCTVLFIVKVFINERFKDKLPIPIPIELVVVIAGTAVSSAIDLNGKHQVTIIGQLTPGFPDFKVPPLKIFNRIFGDSFSIAIISFAM
jgi:MFS superfamily sulfate permease-like transporter